MKIIAHRGIWNSREEGNTLDALEKALIAGFGIETDIRDYRGKLVISHDVATEGSILLEDLLNLYQRIGCDLPLALNVKADGMQKLLRMCLKKYDIRNYFMFDMSVPELLAYLREELNSFSRQSEYEKNPSLYEKVNGIWMDEFQEEWITEEIVRNHMINGKQMGIISPEIHQNPTDRLWSLIKKYKNSDLLMLCTDKPKEAKVFFNI